MPAANEMVAILARDHQAMAKMLRDAVGEAEKVEEDPELAAYGLWRLNWIHPFIEGNGRTARAACYYLLCVRSGALLYGNCLSG